MRFKRKADSILYDATLYGEDAVMVRLASPEPTEFYIMSFDVFLDEFEEYLGPQQITFDFDDIE